MTHITFFTTQISYFYNTFFIFTTQFPIFTTHFTFLQHDFLFLLLKFPFYYTNSHFYNTFFIFTTQFPIFTTHFTFLLHNYLFLLHMMTCYYTITSFNAAAMLQQCCSTQFEEEVGKGCHRIENFCCSIAATHNLRKKSGVVHPIYHSDVCPSIDFGSCHPCFLKKQID